MKLPKLPAPETVEGRQLYTAGQMREYGRVCANAVLCEIDASRIKHNTSGQPKNEIPDFLKGMKGIKT